MKTIIFGLWFIVYGLLPFVYAQDETLTLLTYYPAPYGIYQTLEVLRQDGTSANLMISQYRDTDIYPMITFRKADNTLTLPEAVDDDERLGTFVFSGHDGTSFRTGAEIYAVAEETWTADEWGTQLRFRTRYETNDLIDRMIITDYGSVVVQGQYTNTNLILSNYDNGSGTSIFRLRKADNTIASPEQIDDGDTLGSIRFEGYDNNGFDTGAEIYAVADNNWGASERGTEIHFQTRDGGGTLTDRMIIAANGSVGVNTIDLNSRLYVENTSTVGGNAVEGKGYFGVESRSNSSAGIGIFGKAYNTEPANGYSLPADSGNTGVFGAARQADGKGVYGQANFSGGIGVKGVGNSAGGRFQSTTGYGVYGITSNVASYAGWFEGRVGTDNSQSTAPVKHLYDVAELIPCAGDVEYGDVVVINPDKDREVIKCSKENKSAAGIISENPQFCFGDREKTRELEPEKNWNFLALAGQVYCKVDASYGGISRGDLLTTSPTPGHAMKADNPKIGTIVGKALEPLKEGKGKILVLVCLM